MKITIPLREGFHVAAGKFSKQVAEVLLPGDGTKTAGALPPITVNHTAIQTSFAFSFGSQRLRLKWVDDGQKPISTNTG